MTIVTHRHQTHSAPQHPPQPQPIRLRADCPLAGLNQLFPGGIPVAHPFPTLALSDRPCFELDRRNLSITRTADLMQVLFDRHVPNEIGYAALYCNAIAIPVEWVIKAPLCARAGGAAFVSR